MSTSPPRPSKPPREKIAEASILSLRFYREGFRQMILAVPVLAITVLGLILFAVYLATRPPEIRFIAMGSDGRIVELKALTEPPDSREAVLAWAREAILKTYRMDAVNFRYQVTEMQAYFTPEGFQDFDASLARSGLIKLLERDKAIQSAQPSGAVSLEAEGEVIDSKGRPVKAWQIAMPVQVSWVIGKEGATRNQSVLITVIRRPFTESPFGLGITSYAQR